MRGSSKERFANGVASALIICFFTLHGMLGAAALLIGFASPFAWLVWVGVALIVVHVLLSVLTSKQQLSDKERPPSQRKVRHLALKWLTGGLLAVAATAHVVVMRMDGDTVPLRLVSTIAIVLVAAALAFHLCVGAKSLLKDIGVDRRFKLAFRIVVCTLCAVFALAALAAAVL